MTATVKITEEQLHQQVFQYLSWALDDNAIAFHCPMGGSRNLREAQKLKRLGATAGIPDLMICHKGRAYFIELKTEKGKLSVSQKIIIPRLELAGCAVAVCRSLEDVTTFLYCQAIPVRVESISTTRIRRGLQGAMLS